MYLAASRCQEVPVDMQGRLSRERVGRDGVYVAPACVEDIYGDVDSRARTVMLDYERCLLTGRVPRGIDVYDRR